LRARYAGNSTPPASAAAWPSRIKTTCAPMAFRRWTPCRRSTPPAKPRTMLRPGESAERRAERYLRAQGLRLLDRNYHSPHGEIDLIMQDGATLVFVEVRLRSNPRFGSGADSIDHRKRQ